MRTLLFFLWIPFFCVAQGDGDTAFAKAEILFNAKQYSKARPLFQTALQSEPNNPQIIEYLGDIAGYAKNWDEAIPYYEKLVALKPNEANYHYKYGGVMGMRALEINKLRAIGLIGDIKEAFETAAQLDPKHIEARWALVELYMQLPGIVGGSEAKSRKYADELAKLSPVDGYLAHGYIAEYNDKPVEAERNYKAAVKVGGSVTCYTKLREHYEKNDQPQKAFDTALEAQETHSINDNRLHYQLGKVAGQYGIGLDKGIACLNKYVANYTAADGVPKDWAYLRLAQIYKHKGDKEKAVQWIDKALASRSDFKEALAEKRIIAEL